MAYSAPTGASALGTSGTAAGELPCICMGAGVGGRSARWCMLAWRRSRERGDGTSKGARRRLLLAEGSSSLHRRLGAASLRVDALLRSHASQGAPETFGTSDAAAHATLDAAASHAAVAAPCCCAALCPARVSDWRSARRGRSLLLGCRPLPRRARQQRRRRIAAQTAGQESCTRNQRKGALRLRRARVCTTRARCSTSTATASCMLRLFLHTSCAAACTRVRQRCGRLACCSQSRRSCSVTEGGR